MKDVIGRLFKSFDNEEIEREVDEELRFHLELLTQANLQQDMSPSEATEAALKRFGDVEQIKNECVEISKSGRPLIRALKYSLVVVFLAGVLLRVFGTVVQVIHVGDVLIWIGTLGRLFLYVRGLNPSNFRAKSDASSLLILNDDSSFRTGETVSLTPVERVITGK